MADKFDKAVSIVQGLPKDGPIKPSQDQQLKFYGLYKTGERPGSPMSRQRCGGLGMVLMMGLARSQLPSVRSTPLAPA